MAWVLPVLLILVVAALGVVIWYLATRPAEPAAAVPAGGARQRSNRNAEKPAAGRALDTPTAAGTPSTAASDVAAGTIQQQRAGVLTLAERAMLNSDQFAQRERLQSDIDTVRGADSSDPERIYNPSHYLRSQINKPLTEVGSRVTMTNFYP